MVLKKGKKSIKIRIYKASATGENFVYFLYTEKRKYKVKNTPTMARIFCKLYSRGFSD